MLDKNKASFRSILIIGIITLYLIHFFFPLELFQWILFSFSFSAFCLSIVHLNKIPMLIGSALSLSGAFIIVFFGYGYKELIDGFLMNLPILCLFLIVPLISIPLKSGGYFDGVQSIMQKSATYPKRIFLLITSFLFVIAPVLNIGSIRVVHDLVKKLNLPAPVLAKSYILGFASVSLWSPYFASIILIMFYLDVQVTNFLPYGLVLSFIQLFMGNVIFRRWFHQHQNNFVKAEESVKLDPIKKGALLKTFQFMIVIIGLITSILFLEYLSGYPVHLLVSLTALAFPLLWVLFSRAWTEFTFEIKNYGKSLGRVNNEVVLLLSAGLFGHAISMTPFAEILRLFLYYIADISILLLSLIVIVIVVSLSFIGVHQIIVVPILAMQMNPSIIGISGELLAVILVLAWSISVMFSPLIATNVMVGQLVKRSSLTVSAKWNWKLVLTMTVVGVFYVGVLNSFLNLF